MNNAELYRALCIIRFFEETVLENFPKGYFSGTTHTCLGQEANAVGVLSHLQPQDIVFSNHRGHGHYLASKGDPYRLFAELMGRATGVCGGRGGSQHLHSGNFYSNGIQGGIIPIATGMALAEKYKSTRAIVITFLGDGTFGEGVIYESFNLASKWQAPILYVVENNRIAQTTPIDLSMAGSISSRFAAFDIPYSELETSDVVAIYNEAEKWVSHVRTSASPAAMILHTHRFGPHSKGDDTRPPEEVARLRQLYDPLKIQAKRLTPKECRQIETEVRDQVLQAFTQAQKDPYPQGDTP